jgi:hypothetical protein
VAVASRPAARQKTVALGSIPAPGVRNGCCGDGLPSPGFRVYHAERRVGRALPLRLRIISTRSDAARASAV